MADEARQQRLKQALRENLKRRKEQARVRSDATPAFDDSDRDDSTEPPGTGRSSAATKSS